MSFNPGENVGPYRIIEQLGQGGMATVFKAYHAALDRHVAMKVLHPAFKEDPQFLARFHREAKVVAKLEHPNIIPIYDFSEHKGQPYLVMKFIEGETLKARLSRGTLEIQEAVDVIRAVGDGLNYAHKRGVLHRDVKPSNILLSENDQIYLADFGLARIAELGASTLSGDMLIGTPYYISPEQGSGDKELDERTDIYSFGIVLYEIIVGKVPFTADTPFSIIHDHIYTPLPLPRVVNPSVPEAVQIVLLKALSKKPEDRHSSGKDLADAFIRAVQGMGKPIQHNVSEGNATRKQAGGSSSNEPDKVEVPSQATSRKSSISPWVWVALGLSISCLAFAAILGVGRAQEDEILPTESGPTSFISLPPAFTQTQITDSELDRDPTSTLAPTSDSGDEVVKEDALSHLKRAEVLAEGGKDQAATQEYLLAGEKFLEQGMPIEASQALVQGITLLGGPDVPSSKPLMGLLAQALYYSVEHEEFGSFIAELKGPGPRWPFIPLLEARALILNGEFVRAERIIQEAVTHESDTLFANTLLAELKFAQGNLNEALSIVDEALARPRVEGWLVDVLNDLKVRIQEA